MELFLSVLMMHSYSVTTHFLHFCPPPSSYWLSLSYQLHSLCVFKEVVNVYFCLHMWRGVSVGLDNYILFPRGEKNLLIFPQMT